MNNYQVEQLKKRCEEAKGSNSNENNRTLDEFKAAYPNLAEAFSAIELEQLMLFSKKCLDYGIDNISGGQSLDSKENVEFALNGIWYRMQDKMNRWKNVITNDYRVKCESILDTFQDIANYAMIAQLVTRGLWKK